MDVKKKRKKKREEKEDVEEDDNSNQDNDNTSDRDRNKKGSSVQELHQKQGIRDLVWYLTGLMLSERQNLGYDETMTWDDKGKLQTIQVDGKKYDVTGQIFQSHALRGHTTQCWLVQHDGVE